MPAAGGGRSSGGEGGTGEIYLECRVMGPQMRVAAIDAATGTEVILVVPANLPERDIARLARRKLDRRLAREVG